MSGRRFILEILNEMEQYYHYTYNLVQVEILCQQLSGVPTYLLREAADHWLQRESRWLPRAANFLEIVRRLQESGEVILSTGEPCVALWVQHENLKSAYFQDGELNLTRWQALIDLADYLDRPHSVESFRKSFKKLMDDQKQHQLVMVPQ